MRGERHESRKRGMSANVTFERENKGDHAVLVIVILTHNSHVRRGNEGKTIVRRTRVAYFQEKQDDEPNRCDAVDRDAL
jgi:hypothetical protein